MDIFHFIAQKIRALHAPFYLAHDKRYSQYDIGNYTYGKPTVFSWGEGTTLRIGSFCSFASGVKIFLGGEHRIDWVTTYPFSALFQDAKRYVGHPASKGNVVIGNDVWIGTEAMILSGVRIGNGAVVAARSVVADDVPAYAIAAGNPARIVKYRFEMKIIKRLEKIAWWDWPLERIRKAWPLLLSSDIERFVREFG